jgi:Holliday junction resolvasome RuvABC endonuclease subunit
VDTFTYLGITQVDEIRIEGFSYMSKGNSFIDLITYNTYLKVKLIQKFGHCIKVVPPKTLKKAYTGNGNATKCDMMRKYIEDNNNKITEKIKELGFIKEVEFNIPKPLDDIIDAIALTSIWDEN